jgi:tRNA G18 (ribose-2'-O)-methylase SpoU
VVEQIAHPDDPRISDYAHVGDHVWLRRNGLFVAEGRLLALRLIAEWPSSVHSLLVTPAARVAVETTASPLHVPIYVADPSIVHSLTGINFHRGCLALGRRPRPVDPGVFAGARRLVALEGIANPDNVGGIFRVAAAFGVQGILLDPATADPLYRKSLRTSMGSVFTVPFTRITEWPNALTRLSIEAGFKLIAMTTRAQATPLATWTQATDSPSIVMFGSESRGLSDSVVQLADQEVTIAMRPAVDSLNVVVAAGIALAQLPDPQG